jgi:hypothetical protein
LDIAGSQSLIMTFTPAVDITWTLVSFKGPAAVTDMGSNVSRKRAAYGQRMDLDIREWW